MTSKTTHITAALLGALVAFLIVFATGKIKEPEGPIMSAVDELFAADRAFSLVERSAGFGGAFDAFSADDVVTFSGSAPIRGRAAVVESFSDAAPATVAWAPEGGEASADGTLGYTWGPYSVTAPGNETVISRGHYITVWRKDSAGVWKVIADIGNVIEEAGDSE